MNTVYVIGDTHFGHKLVAESRGYKTVEAHDEDLALKLDDPRYRCVSVEQTGGYPIPLRSVIE